MLIIEKIKKAGLLQEVLDEIHDWHGDHGYDDCEYPDCEIKKAIDSGVSDEELVNIAYEEDYDLFERWETQLNIQYKQNKEI